MPKFKLLYVVYKQVRLVRQVRLYIIKPYSMRVSGSNLGSNLNKGRLDFYSNGIDNCDSSITIKPSSSVSSSSCGRMNFM